MNHNHSGSMPMMGKVKRKNFGGGKGTSFTEKSVGWGDLPGKASKDRSGGTKKVKQYPVSKGL